MKLLSSVVSAQWHLNLSTQRWSSAHPSTQRQSWVSSSWEVLTLHHSSLVPLQWHLGHWLPFLLELVLRGRLPYGGSGKHFFQARWSPFPPRMTLVVSKFNHLIKVVMTSTYQFSSSVWSGGAIGLVNSTLDMVVEVVWVAASIRLVSCPIGQSSVWSLVKGTVAFIHSEMVTHGDFGESALPRSVGVGWGHQLVVPGLILPKPWMKSCLVKMMCFFTLSLSSRTLLTKGWKSGSTGGLSLSAHYCNPWA